MKSVLFLMASVLFVGVVFWASSSLDLKSALNISAGVFSLGLVLYSCFIFLVSLVGLLFTFLQESESARYFAMAIFFTFVDFYTIHALKEHKLLFIFFGYPAENIIMLLCAVPVTIMVIIAIRTAFKTRHY